MYRIPQNSDCQYFKSLRKPFSGCPKVGSLTEAGRYCRPKATCDVDGGIIFSGSSVELAETTRSSSKKTQVAEFEYKFVGVQKSYRRVPRTWRGNFRAPQSTDPIVTARPPGTAWSRPPRYNTPSHWVMTSSDVELFRVAYALFSRGHSIWSHLCTVSQAVSDLTCRGLLSKWPKFDGK